MVDSPEQTPSPKADRDTVHFVGSNTLATANIVDKSLTATDLDRSMNSSALQQAVADYDRELMDHVQELTGLSAEIVTGAQTLHRALSQNPDLARYAAVNMAPDTFNMVHATEGVRTQVERGLAAGEEVTWNGPVAVVESSRIVFHGLTESLATSRAGTAGRGTTQRQAIDEALTHFKDADANGVVLIDDRGSKPCNSLRDVARHFMAAGFDIKAFVVGHSARTEFTNSSQHTRNLAPLRMEGDSVVDEVPIYSYVFRYQDPDDENFGRGAPADELTDLTYYYGSGHSLQQGYLEQADANGVITNVGAYPYVKAAFDEMQNVLRSNKSAYSGEDFDSLRAVGIKVSREEDLIRFFENKSKSGTLIDVHDLQRLFAHQRGDEGILTVITAPHYNPEVMEERRAPMIWPGTPEEKSFMNWLTTSRGQEDLTKWFEFSRRALEATSHHIESLEAAMGGIHVPKTVLGFVGIPKIEERLERSTLRSDRALDYVHGLLNLIERERPGAAGGSAQLAQATGAAAEASSVRQDDMHPDLKAWF